MFAAMRAGPADVGLDLGSTTVRAVVRGRGLALELPNLMAIGRSAQGPTEPAFGDDAKRMVGRTSGGTRIIAPIRAGAIADFEATERVLQHVLHRVLGRQALRGPRVLATVPTDATEVQRRAFLESARAAGCREVQLVPSATAAAIGAGLPVLQPRASMLVDVGGGHAEVTVLSLGGRVAHRTLATGGEAMDAALVSWLRRHHALLIGEPTAERVKLEVGAAGRPARVQRVRVRGRDLSTGAPKTFDMDGEHVAEALSEVVVALRDGVLAALAETPPELCADLSDSGVLLVGGAARLSGLDAVLGHAAGLPFLLAEQPERVSASGLARLLDDADLYARVVHPTAR